jgi:hypothetical protein
MNVYIKEKGEVRTLILHNAEGEEITEKYLFLVKNSCLYPAPPEICKKYCVDYVMYRDDYNECTTLLNDHQRLINKAKKQKQNITSALYETIIDPGRVIEYAN